MDNKVSLVFNCEQRSPEWLAMKVGMVSGSKAIGLTTPARMKTYLSEKVTEILTGEIEPVFTTDAMIWGTEQEPIARELYAAQLFAEPIQIDIPAVVLNEDYKFAVLSPDGLIGEVGAIEIKCPGSKKHITTILEKKIPDEHIPQITWYFVMLPDLQWLDFMSYDPRIESYPVFQRRITRKELKKEIDKMIAGYFAFEAELISALALLRL